jgi:hypothetical protein
MDIDAETFFSAKFIWNDILCSAVEKKMPASADLYRKLLADEAFSTAFKDTIGCETWIMTAILDITSLEIKKSEQTSQGSLSIHGLVSQANRVECVVDREMIRLSSLSQRPRPQVARNDETVPHDITQSIVYGHAVLIFLNTVVSGALAGVPEIHQSIARAISSWEMIPPMMNPKHLSWAYSTSASLATGSQREVFRNVVARMSGLNVDLHGLREFHHGVEQCWEETDRSNTTCCNIPCDWRYVHKRLNLDILFVV